MEFRSGLTARLVTRRVRTLTLRTVRRSKWSTGPSVRCRYGLSAYGGRGSPADFQMEHGCHVAIAARRAYCRGHVELRPVTEKRT